MSQDAQGAALRIEGDHPVPKLTDIGSKGFSFCVFHGCRYGAIVEIRTIILSRVGHHDSLRQTCTCICRVSSATGAKGDHRDQFSLGIAILNIVRHVYVTRSAQLNTRSSAVVNNNHPWTVVDTVRAVQALDSGIHSDEYCSPLEDVIMGISDEPPPYRASRSRRILLRKAS
ncbi:hypothetical protein BC629DRAFT_1445276 [Irpex lacteus]|nr:hypothetical protein BC629DRAFT_1445276 [Irpex lacteus]